MGPSISDRPVRSNVRWVVCALLFFATVIAYVDRGIVSFLERFLEGKLAFTSVEYSRMTAGLQAAYAIGFVLAGRLTDQLGIRKTFTLAMIFWSMAAMAPGMATSALSLGVAMVFLGFCEAANFPACIRAVAEWFPKRERALATGLFNSGANVGNLLVPLIVPFLMGYFTWRQTFFIGGSFGLIWLLFWLWLYHKPEEHPGLSVRELGHIQSDPPEKIQSVPWGRLAFRKETWAFGIAKALTDPVWWFWTFWLPRYFQTTFHLTLGKSSAPIVIGYAMCCVGSVGGGWLSSFLLNRGKSVNFSRKTALLVCSLFTLPVLYAPFCLNLWLVVFLVGLALSAHQGFSANLFTLVSDLFPRAAVGSVTGIGAMAGAAAGCLVQLAIGLVVRRSYLPCFIFAGSAYLLALLFIHLLSPRLMPAKLDV